MGNVASDVTNNIKAQADAQECDVYRLVDLKGGGELIQLLKSRIQDDSDTINEEIKQRMAKFVYDKGNGKSVPISKYIELRGKLKQKSKNSTDTIENLVFKSDNNNKLACWEMENRGAVGETPLHLCLLVNSSVHIDLAKRMVKLFPNLVRDIYLSDEYYGESALHIAIVNEDPAMVKFLLVNGADVHQRCAGNFFTPDDQKSGRQDILTQECPVLPVQTNYEGYSYFGEYALSFAAVMNQIDCVRLLLAKGADPNKQDSNGNTVLHMLVIHNNLEMFKQVLEYGAKIDICNRLNLTPLTLSAKLARTEFFEFLMKRNRSICWVYANISCAAYPLTGIDTIASDGTTDSNSVLYSIMTSTTDKHLDLINDVIFELLQAKWRAFVKFRFYLELLFFFIFYILTFVTIMLKHQLFEYLKEDKCTNTTEKGSSLTVDCKCAYWQSSDSIRYARYIFELLVLMFAISFLGISVWEFFIQKYKLFFETLFANSMKISLIISCLTLILIIPVRFSCQSEVEDIMVILALISMSYYFFHFCRGFRAVGPFILIVHKMVKKDFVRFFIIYIVFLMGFSQAMYLVFNFGIDMSQNMFRTPIEAIFNMFVIALGEFTDIFLALEKAKYSEVGKILYVFYMILVGLLLINLLIAMMGNTFATVHETKKEWLRQWAKIIISIEQSVSLKNRLKYQERYTKILKNGEKSLVVSWIQSENERNEFISKKNYLRKHMINVNKNID